MISPKSPLRGGPTVTESAKQAVLSRTPLDIATLRLQRLADYRAVAGESG